MKVSVWRNFESDMSDSIDFEFDASNKDEAAEFEKYMGLYLGVAQVIGKEAKDEDLKELLKTHCLFTPVFKE